ncbi:MAG: hypothetical protein U9Q07_03855 [Planctomycetota bacterium]|nr:hypothetical protein [Planctomycetota bacterium]
MRKAKMNNIPDEMIAYHLKEGEMITMEVEATPDGLQAEIIAKTPRDMLALGRALNIHEPGALLQILSVKPDNKNYKRIRIARVERDHAVTMPPKKRAKWIRERYSIAGIEALIEELVHIMDRG